MGPAGSINSNVEEMSRWMLVHLGDGQYKDTRLIQAGTLEQLHTPQMAIASLPDEPEVGPQSYAMGWFVDTYRGHLRVHHGGSIDGFLALVTLFPHDDTGIVVLTNAAGNPLPGLITRHAMDLLEKHEPRNWLAEALAKKKQAEAVQEEADAKKESVRVAGTKPSHPIADYAGDYFTAGYGTLKITRDGEKLTMTYNGISAPLNHWHYDVFRAGRGEDPTFEDSFLMFRADLAGNIAHVDVPIEATLPPITFEKQPDARMKDPQYLQKFTGEYALGPTTFTVTLQGNTLVLNVPGQPVYQLEPAVGGWFELANMTGFRVRFETDAQGKVVSLISAQPNGVFTAKKK
jgi:hypothetical protein